MPIDKLPVVVKLYNEAESVFCNVLKVFEYIVLFVAVVPAHKSLYIYMRGLLLDKFPIITLASVIAPARVNPPVVKLLPTAIPVPAAVDLYSVDNIAPVFEVVNVPVP